MATAKKLPSGSWRVQLYIGKDAADKRQYLSFTAPTKKEAEYEALQYQIHYKEVAKDTSAMTLEEAMEKYIQSKDGVLSPSTIRGYDIIKREHLNGLKSVKLNRLTQPMVQAAINLEAKPKTYTDKKGNVRTKTSTPKTVRNIYGFLTAVLAAYHPSLNLDITLPQEEVTEQSWLEPEEIATLLKVIDGTEMDIPILLAAWLCMRSSEITGLTWDCIDFDRKTITVKQARVRNKDNEWVSKGTKTKKSTRTILAPDYIMDKLAAAKESATTDHVVNIRGNCLYQRFKVILKNNGLPDIRFHDLRHTAASIMALLNVPKRYAQERGGWSTAHTMDKAYTHTMTSKRSSVASQINTYYESLMQ